jgi:hypothetical protein
MEVGFFEGSTRLVQSNMIWGVTTFDLLVGSHLTKECGVGPSRVVT